MSIRLAAPSRRRLRNFAFGTALALVLAGTAQAAAPRDVVGRVADQIAARYFDAQTGARISAELKAEAARGDYDRYATPDDLSAALTARLRPQDAHFQVAWSPAGPAHLPGARVAPALAASAENPERLANYGFRAVEILPGGIAVIRMSHFADFEGASGEAKTIADGVMALTANAEAVIFDLRDNIGGSPVMVAYLVSHFVPEGADVYNLFKTRSSDEYERPTAPPATGRRLAQPVYVLISGRSASAAESFSYTLQAAGRGVVVGETSAGGANPGENFDLGEGYSVFISDGAPINPITKTNWEGTGVTPDVAAPAGDALIKAQQLALAKVLEAPGGEARKTEARWALEALAPAAPVKSLPDYAGAYGSRSVIVAEGRLQIVQKRRVPQSLKPLAVDSFAVEGPGAPVKVAFERDAAGRVSAMTMAMSTGQTARFARSN